MKKYLIVLLMLVVFVPGAAFAQNNDALIQSLLQQIIQLQTLLVQLLNHQQVPPVVTPPSNSGWQVVNYGASGVSLNLPTDWAATLNNIGADGGYAASVGPVLSTSDGSANYNKCVTLTALGSTNGAPVPLYESLSLGGRGYCLVTLTDAATGHVSTQYTYVTKLSDRYVSTKFQIIAVNNSQSPAVFSRAKSLLNQIMSSATYSEQVVDPSAPAGFSSVLTDKSSYSVGQTITVSWQQPAGSSNPNIDLLDTSGAYTNGNFITNMGTVNSQARSLSWTIPTNIKPGSYHIRIGQVHMNEVFSPVFQIN